jgi:imidazolonepropionase-like amidohydrolase
MTLFALAFAAVTGSVQDGSVAYHFGKVVIAPGKVVKNSAVYVQGGKVVRVGPAPKDGVFKVIDLTDYTCYPGFVHPGLATGVDGVTPSPASGGGFGQTPTVEQQRARDEDPFNRKGNLLFSVGLATAKDLKIDSLATLAKAGYGVARIVPNGGIIGPQAGVVSTGDVKPASVIASTIPVVRVASRGFGSGYPSSTMGVITTIRQAFYDAIDYAGDDAGWKWMSATANQSGQVSFEGLTETSFFQAARIAEEFKLKPVYAFRQDAGRVKGMLAGSTVILEGRIPAKPTIGDDLSRVSIKSVRDYVNEVQVGAELERAKIDFVYGPSTGADMVGIRTYVRGGLSRDRALAALTTAPAKMLGLEREVGTLEDGKRANFVVVQGDVFDSSSQIMASYVDGKKIEMEMPSAKRAEDLKADPAMKLPAPNYALFPAPAETKVANRLYRNATVWTMGPRGVLRNADVLVQGGKITAVGSNLQAPRGCEVIDSTGKHISPGIWDAHSHTGIVGSVNDGANMISAECRIRDCVNHTDNSIYVQLSGGTVGALQLHGSANAIGGQSNTVKWRWGMNPWEFPVAGAPEGVKFALGQNPIREDTGGASSNGTTLLTYRPRTRMGVDDAIRRALQLGREYEQSWADFKAGKTTKKPRRDLHLEAMGEIATGRRWIHSHAYRADEMLTLMREVVGKGPKLATLQHVLEGYKIADEMAAAGVGGSTFADWWGFKLESYDAIPHNPGLMSDRGVVVSVNSDSDNHARRLNQEAAKSIRYAGTDAETALSFVTTGPAKQLGIFDRTGSIEPGKDADLAIWTDAPTDIHAVCLETYVDGVKRFDRANDAKQREDRLAELKAARAMLAESGDGVFKTGNDPAPQPVNAGKSTATFGIAKITGQPGTARYPRSEFLIKGATVHPMVGNPFVGDVLIGADGKIKQAGAGLGATIKTVVDGTGKHVYPGLIDPATGLGLAEIGQVPAADDSSERGDFHPDYQYEKTMNPEWDSLAVARHQGVLTAIIKPSGGGIPGQAALIHTEGYTWEDFVIQGGVAMVTGVGGGGGRFGDGREDTVRCCELDILGELGGHDHEHEEDMMYRAGLVPAMMQSTTSSMSGIDSRIEDAKKYAGERSAATADKPVPYDARHEAMLKVADGSIPLMISVNSASDIKSVVEWAEKSKIKVVLYGCTGAGEIADWLAQKQVPILLSAVFGQPSADQPVDYFYSLPGKLAKAGVVFGLTTNNNHDVRQLRDMAGWASAYGMDAEDAARSITLWTAQTLGIDDRMGAIMPGLDGTLILTDGPITETSTRVLQAWIQGRDVSLETRQTRFTTSIGLAQCLVAANLVATWAGRGE